MSYRLSMSEWPHYMHHNASACFTLDFTERKQNGHLSKSSSLWSGEEERRKKCIRERGHKWRKKGEVQLKEIQDNVVKSLKKSYQKTPGLRGQHLWCLPMCFQRRFTSQIQVMQRVRTAGVFYMLAALLEEQQHNYGDQYVTVGNELNLGDASFNLLAWSFINISLDDKAFSFRVFVIVVTIQAILLQTTTVGERMKFRIFQGVRVSHPKMLGHWWKLGVHRENVIDVTPPWGRAAEDNVSTETASQRPPCKDQRKTTVWACCVCLSFVLFCVCCVRFCFFSYSCNKHRICSSWKGLHENSW